MVVSSLFHKAKHINHHRSLDCWETDVVYRIDWVQGWKVVDVGIGRLEDDWSGRVYNRIVREVWHWWVLAWLLVGWKKDEKLSGRERMMNGRVSNL